MSRLHQMQSRTNYSENSLMIKDTLMNIFINNDIRFGKKNVIGKYKAGESIYMICIYKSIRFCGGLGDTLHIKSRYLGVYKSTSHESCFFHTSAFSLRQGQEYTIYSK